MFESAKTEGAAPAGEGPRAGRRLREAGFRCAVPVAAKMAIPPKKLRLKWPREKGKKLKKMLNIFLAHMKGIEKNVLTWFRYATGVCCMYISMVFDISPWELRRPVPSSGNGTPIRLCTPWMKTRCACLWRSTKRPHFRTCHPLICGSPPTQLTTSGASGGPNEGITTPPQSPQRGRVIDGGTGVFKHRAQYGQNFIPQKHS